MGIAVKVLIGLVLLLPMTAYVVGSLVAAADPPRQHDPIIVQEQTQKPKPSQSPSAKPTKKAGHDKGDDHGGRKGQSDDGPGTVVITPSPEVFDDHGGNSGKGGGGDDSGGDSSGKGSGDG